MSVNPNVQALQQWANENAQPGAHRGLLRISGTGSHLKIEYLSTKTWFQKLKYNTMAFLGVPGMDLQSIVRELGQHPEILDKVTNSRTIINTKIDSFNRPKATHIFCKKIDLLVDPSNPSSAPIPYKIDPNVLQDLKKFTPQLHEFLTNQSFKYDANKHDYDLGSEVKFGVFWINPTQHQNDRKFIDDFQKRFKSDMKLLEDIDKNEVCRFLATKSTRLANNNINELLQKSVKYPKCQEMLRYALTYCLSLDYPDQKQLNAAMGKQSHAQ